MSIIIFLIILAALILVHEFGHFIVAKKSGIRVDEFGLGFPPRIWSKKYGETTYSLNWIPFGGFVKIFGENPDAESTTGPDSSRSFVNKNRMIQASVLIAGIAFNLLFAWILISFSFMTGILASSSDYAKYGDNFVNPHTAVIGVNKDTPADIVGIKAGDAIVSIQDDVTKDEIRGMAVNVEAIQGFISSHTNKNLILTLERNGETIKKTVMPKNGIVEGRVAIGIAMDDVGTLHLPLQTAVWEGARLTGHMIVGVSMGLGNFIYQIFTGSANFSSISGPVGIVGLVGDATKLGFSYLLSFTAIISINLAIINLIPFPALDGGRLLFVLIEAIRRKEIPPQIANLLNMIGFALLILLMIVVTYRDILKLVQ
ncbi:MAG: RIP metalloprotease RseP [Patescibacteria group bacterium]|nr:RIP metalloprotease RseP [Patescibacteria group bacterium]